MRRVALVLALVAACGDDDPTSPDAPSTPDAPPLDAAVADAAGTTVSVTTYGRCCADTDDPAAGVAVFVRGPDGTLIDEDVTDAQGEATLEVVANASVTALYDLDERDVFPTVTYLGVQPGDELVFSATDELDAPDYGPPADTMSVTWTPPSAVGGYSVVTSCDRQELAAIATSATIGVYPACLVTNIDVMVTARDLGGALVSSTVVDDATFTADGTLALPAFTPLVPFDAGATGLPLSITSVQFEVSPIVGTRAAPGSFTTVDNTTGSVTSSAGIPDGADGARVHTFLYRGNAARQELFRVVADGVTTATVTGADALPWVGGVTADRATRTLSWTLDGATAYDGVHATLEWSVGGAVFGGQERRWTVIAPPGTSLRWPELPAAHAASDVPSDRNVDLTVDLVETAGASSYDDVRHLGEAWVRCPECAPLDPATFPPAQRSTASGDLVAE